MLVNRIACLSSFGNAVAPAGFVAARILAFAHRSERLQVALEHVRHQVADLGRRRDALAFALVGLGHVAPPRDDRGDVHLPPLHGRVCLAAAIARSSST